MAKQLPFRFILASASVGRRELLARVGYIFDVIPSNIEEPTSASYPDIRTLVQHIAWLKAAAVASRVPEGVVLAADSVSWLHGEVFGKPNGEMDARRILRRLSGSVHELWTGVCLWRRPDDLQIAWQEKSLVQMKSLTDAELDIYLQTRTWQGCAGAYAIQEHNDPYVQVIEGSISNVIGLPMESLERILPAMSHLPERVTR